MGNEVAVDQLKTVMKVAAKTGEAAISSVEAVEAATAAETSMTEASSVIVVATAVAATGEAAVVQAGLFFFPLPPWQFPQAHRTSPLEYPSLLDVAMAPEAAVLRVTDLYSGCPLEMLRSGYPFLH